MNKRYVVRLADDEREHLEALARRSKAHARKLAYARILPKADAAEEGSAECGLAVQDRGRTWEVEKTSTHQWKSDRGLSTFT
jgi:hypothetical protein